MFDPVTVAIFSGTSGTVTVSGTVSPAAGLQFKSDGYILSGGTAIDLTGASAGANSISTDASVTATISTPLTGSNGFTKDGPGTLVLDSALNTVSGAIAINAGILSVGADANLGNTANDIALGGGTLTATASISLDAGRDLSGNGSIDVGSGNTVTVNGVAATGVLTLPSAGNVTLNGATKTTGALTFGSTGTLQAGTGTDTIGVAGNITANNASGTSTVNGNVDFGSSARTITTAAGGTFAITGNIITTNRVTYGGAGTVDLQGTNFTAGSSSTLGTSGAAGPTLIVHNGQSLGQGAPSSQFRFNSGTLQAASALTGASAIDVSVTPSIGSEAGNSVILAGSNIDFNGSVSLFKPTGYSGALEIVVNNTTGFLGGWTVSTGSGTPSGFTVSGSGKLILGAGTLAVDLPITVDTATLVVNGTMTNAAASIDLTNGADLQGTGTIAGTVTGTNGTLAPGNSVGTLTVGGLTLSSASVLDYEFNTSPANDLINTTLSGSLLLNGGGFNLYQEGGVTPFSTNGIYNVLGYSGALGGSVTNLSVLNPQAGKTYSFSANGSFVQLTIANIPEPASFILLAMGLVGLAAVRRRA